MLLNFIIAIITDAFSKVKGEQNIVSLDLQITRAWKKLLRSFTWKKMKSRFFALGWRIRDMFLCKFGSNNDPLRELFEPSVNCLPPSVNYLTPL